MNRKVSIFILLILLASSFKYRSKSAEAKLAPSFSVNGVGESPAAKLKRISELEFEKTVATMQDANREFALGNTAPLKALCAPDEDVSDFDGFESVVISDSKVKVPKIGFTSSKVDEAIVYSFEKIKSEVGTDIAYLMQNEHYNFANGKIIDLQATLLFRKEGPSWKLIHRHADNLASNKAVK